MKLSDIKPIPALNAVLTAAGVTEIIYEGSKPTSALPTSFIEIIQNGSYKSSVNQIGILDGVLLLSINAILKSTGEINTIKEDIILKTFDSLFENNKTVVSGKCHFSLDNSNLVYSGRGISEGYSTRIINILVKIY